MRKKGNIAVSQSPLEISGEPRKNEEMDETLARMEMKKDAWAMRRGVILFILMILLSIGLLIFQFFFRK